jgi:hypothetical protein
MDPSIDPAWAQKIDKHARGIDLATATDKDLDEYLATKLYTYTLDGFTDRALWCMFQEDFQGWTADNFKAINNNKRLKLRIYLLERGVYVAPYHSRRPLYEVLLETLQEPERHKWTDEELVAALEEVKTMTSIALRHRLNPSQDALATQSRQALTTNSNTQTPPNNSGAQTPQPYTIV